MRLFNGTDLVLYFFFYAFAAWVLETLIFSLRRQRFVNCGILDLPLLLSHGTAMVILIIVSSGDIPYHSQAVFAIVMTLTIGYLGEGIAESSGCAPILSCAFSGRYCLRQSMSRWSLWCSHSYFH